jgi:hypothetical protein
MNEKEQIEYDILCLKLKIENKESLMFNGVITNDRTVKNTKRDIKRWKSEIVELKKLL